MEKVLTIPEFAEAWKVSTSTVKRLIKRGMPTVMVMGCRRIESDVARSWMLQQQRRTRSKRVER